MAFRVIEGGKKNPQQQHETVREGNTWKTIIRYTPPGTVILIVLRELILVHSQ
ncbi:MAG: hypothetical protein ACE5F4_01760 [Candidatus Paceibacteria bacterium]